MSKTEIAVIGMACEYPDAKTPQELWENVLSQRQAFRRIPNQRLNREAYISTDQTSKDQTYAQRAAVIEGYQFDRVHYRISQASYEQADPVHWLALDVAARALKDADIQMGQARTGVVLGNSLTGEFTRASSMRLRWPFVKRVLEEQMAAEAWTQEQRQYFLDKVEASYKQPFTEMGDESLAGGLANTIAGRICNYFDFKGGGYTVDGACASSLLSVIHGCRALERGDLDTVLVGGVDLSLDPFELVGFARAGALSENDMLVYDAQARGFIPGEGCGLLVLQRLDDALVQNKKVYAVIHGGGISSDGKGGITRPEVDGQYLAVTRAYEHCDYNAREVGYFEGHGTGTALGDQVEITTLERAREGAETIAALGSVKMLIGHTKAAAGVAGFIKTVMALHHQILPPMIQQGRPNELLRSMNLPKTGTLWTETLPLRAGVSAMGFGGINTHVTLASREPRRTALTEREQRLCRSAQDSELVVLAAEDWQALSEQCEQFAAIVLNLSLAEMRDFAAYTYSHCAQGRVRAAVVASHPETLSEQLHFIAKQIRSGKTKLMENDYFLGEATEAPSIGFLFPGNGAPHYYEEHALSLRFPLVAELYQAWFPEHQGNHQLAVTLSSIAGLELCTHFGIAADVGMGHSLGEYAAMYWAGAIGKDEVLSLVRQRHEVIAKETEPGAMTSLACDAETATRIAENVVVSVHNHARQTVLSGTETNILAAEQMFRDQGIASIRVPVTTAFHSPAMEPAAEAFAAYLREAPFQKLQKNIYSTVTGQLLERTMALAPYFETQLTKPVLFCEAFERANQQVDLWLELGAGQLATSFAKHGNGKPSVATDVGGSQIKGWLRACAASWVLGAPVKLEKLAEDRCFKPFDPNKQQTFFTNPCERVLVDSTTDIEEQTVVTEAQDDPIGETPLDVVRHLISKNLGLPLAQLNNQFKVLEDLHLTSLSVTALISEAAEYLDARLPASTAHMANASIEEIAATLESLMGAEKEEPEIYPAGIGRWVACYQRELHPEPHQGVIGRADAKECHFFGVEDHPFKPLLERLNLPETVFICLSKKWSNQVIEDLLAGAQFALSRKCPLVFLAEHPLATGFARTFAQENPEANILIFISEGLPKSEWLEAEVSACHGFAEVYYNKKGVRCIPKLVRVQPQPSTAGLTSDDVVLVTGGGKGIAEQIALNIAKKTGATMILMGRSKMENDTQLVANLSEWAGLKYRYIRADVLEPQTMASALVDVVAAFGPVTALIHAAGMNLPTLIPVLDEDRFDKVLAPKVSGLDNVLATLDPKHLRLLVGFGSIIARIGVAGEAAYATANELLAEKIAQYGCEHGHCRCLTMEYSLWAEIGMIQNVENLDYLRRSGIEPIAPEAGIETFMQLLESSMTGPVLVTSRFGPPKTVHLDKPQLPFLRFLERPRIHYPGLELVVDVRLNGDNDPYLSDHVYDGAALFPTVMGLEAMAQVTMALMEKDTPPNVFEDISLNRPIAVPVDKDVIIRICAIALDENRVKLVIRSHQTRFEVDHFSGIAIYASNEDVPVPSVDVKAIPEMAIKPESQLYGSLFFHKGRFKTIQGYRCIRAFQAVADLEPVAESWFGWILPQPILLGDPGSRDAVLHGVQVCVPGESILPLSVGSIQMYGATEGPHHLNAIEKEHRGDVFLYDLEVIHEDGQLCEVWRDVAFKAVRLGKKAHFEQIPELLASYYQRKYQNRFFLAVAHGPELEASIREQVLRFRLDAIQEHRPELSYHHEADMTVALGGKTVLTSGLFPIKAEVSLDHVPQVWTSLGQDDVEQRTRVFGAHCLLERCGPETEMEYLREEDGAVTFISGDIEILTLKLGTQILVILFERKA